MVDGKTCCSPGNEATDDICGPLESEFLKPQGGEARGVALMADEDEPVLVAGQRGTLMPRRWIDPPFENA